MLVLLCQCVIVAVSIFSTVNAEYSFSNEPYDVIIPCGPKDKEVLKLCIEGIKKNISYRRLIVLSPHKYSHEAEWFNEALFPFTLYQVAFELNNRSRSKTKSYLKKKNNRAGWFYQQLLKFYAPFVIPGISSNVLVVDADLIFLNSVEFMNENNAPLLNSTSFEYYWPYFTHAKRLIPGFKRNELGLSGISHHMLFQKPVIEALFSTVEKHHKLPFWKAFLMQVKRPYDADASEYEIYMNFLLSTSNQAEWRPLQWQNVDKIDNLEELRGSGFDFVTYHWYLR